ncbi:MAG: adenylyltransferase/cytidyltransferase family protein [Nanoarchaeota archaeon]
MIEINTENYETTGILSEEEIKAKTRELRKEGKIVGLCTGSFDLLHIGHVAYLEAAKKMCDVLVVGVADDSLSTRKKSQRGGPIFSYEVRAFMVGRLKPVDFVIRDDGLLNIFHLVYPHFYIKGSDYKNETAHDFIKSKEIVKSLGIKMAYAPCVLSDSLKISTADIIDYIKNHVK